LVAGTVEGTASGSPEHAPAAGRSLRHHRAGPRPGQGQGKADLGAGISHLVIQVESLDATLADLAVKGIEAEQPGLPGGADGPRTSWITDPDGYRIELVQWPAGHADGITKADFA
jgi:lactoylglutathione lyase